jgi:multiple sugar transport system permease protein
MKKQNTPMILAFLAPTVIIFLVIYLYPIVRTIIMSFFTMKNVTSPMSDWTFNGINSYIYLFQQPTFLRSLWNIFRIWVIGGIGVMVISLLYAVLLTADIAGKKVFRTIIYLPNIISGVAMGTMWLFYIYEIDIGMFNSVIRTFGGQGIEWTNADNIFWSMLLAFAFGNIGYFMLIFISGIDRIGPDFYEAARIEGANVFQQFFSITLPLLTGVLRSNIVIYTIGCTGFFVWSQVFSPLSFAKGTVSPIQYMYDLVFGGVSATAVRNVGAGAAIGVILAVIVAIVTQFINFLNKREDTIEF